MDPRVSLACYPRVDLDFINKKSLDFDMMKTQIMIKRGWGGKVEAARWFLNFLIGVVVGVLAFAMSCFEEFLLEKRTEMAKVIIEIYEEKGQ